MNFGSSGNLINNYIQPQYICLVKFEIFNPNIYPNSYHEMALYDLPALIDHALAVSGQEKVVYIGHSMGTTMSYVLLSEKPEYNKKISLLVSLAPIAYWKVPPGQSLITWARHNSEWLKVSYSYF